MQGFHDNIEELTLRNNNFRKVLYTGKHSQLVVMCLQIGEEIGMETHHDNDQFFRFEQGEGKCVIDGNEHIIKNGSAIIIPAGSLHNIINTSTSLPLKMYTIYSPAHHKDGTIHNTKNDAINSKEEFDGMTTE